jgi:predicted PurR-regulated permease PerM
MNPKLALESVIRIVSVGFIFYFCFLIFKPFTTLFVWSLVIGITLYPLFQWLVKLLKGKRTLVAVILNLVFILLVLIPIIRLGNSLASQAKSFKGLVTEDTLHIPEPNAELKEWPLVGEPIYNAWTSLYTDMEQMVKQYSAEISEALGWLFNGLVQISVDALMTLAALIISTFLMLHAEAGYSFALKFFQRISDPIKGEVYCHDARDTIRNVVKGVVLVALIQASLAGLGFVLIGLPAPGLWALLIFVVAVMQLPASIITLPLAAYVFSYANTGPAIVFAVYSVMIGFVDNILKPIYLGRGKDIPMLVILIGSLGGMIFMGILGLFIGPVIFSLGYKLLVSWMNELPATEPKEAE